jgi:hypothetical protein
MRHLHSGLHYLRLLPALQEVRPVRSYLEIGVNMGKSLCQMNCGSIGIDPHFVIDRDVRGSKPFLHLLEMTSDDYFKTVRTELIFPDGIDVAFLDGLHLLEALLNDFINVEPLMAPDGIVFMHDCLPINAEMTERDRRPALRKDVEYKSHWTGDVWKLVPILRQYRPDLRLQLLDCEPTGLVAVTGFDSSSTVLRDEREAIVAKYMPVEMTDASLADFYRENERTPATAFLEQVTVAAASEALA